MREHKFRAWSRVTHSMWWFDVTWGNFLAGSGWAGMLPIGETDKNKRTQIDPGSCELLEYTGKKDKNGEEVCEGDIALMIAIDGERIYTEVVWDQQLCQFLLNPISCSKRKYVPNAWNLERTFEVIGNIYENPELLEKEES